MILRKPAGGRSGATAVESTVVLSVFLLLILGMICLGAAVLGYNLLSGAVRQGARQAIIHGSEAPPALGQWGPKTINTTANNTGVPLVQAVRPYLTGLNLPATRVQAVWLDGDNNPGSRVEVTIRSPYPVSFFFVNATLTLQASSVMTIVH